MFKINVRFTNSRCIHSDSQPNQNLSEETTTCLGKKDRINTFFQHIPWRIFFCLKTQVVKQCLKTVFGSWLWQYV